jgi:transcriptional regulator with XRE-family HTH domain
MEVVASWTGERADALRQAFRMTNESFAEYLGVAVRTVAYWRERPNVIPRPAMQEILDTALARAPEATRSQFSLILAERGHVTPGHRRWPAEDLPSLTAWITASNASDEAIEYIDRATLGLAGRHTQVPARQLLADVLQVHGKAQLLLRGGRQRLRQTRELMRVEGSALAHASVLLGDLGQDHEAEKYGQAAVIFLQEADASPATALYALAKTARWQQDHATAADLARQGFEYGPVDPMNVQLAYYEANSAALLGDQYRARHALIRADQIAESLPASGASGSPWSFPAERRAIFRLSVLLRTGDPRGALAAAETADRGWDAGDPYIPGTWAQIRIGAAIAHLQQNSLDGAAEQVSPMLTLAPEFRISTVTGYLAVLDGRLARPRFAASRTAQDLRQEIREFQTAALPPHAGGTR